eukprot:TRINITY_DN67_c0_g1_i11.p1 TRINITY_DN67_c0_g1~~TRINITY_DN67_c0_g1_i11.p1  ORF type:complete len:577 (-),score=150.00 TRINITY_DN67_c0_g1_i11:421-2151(-)
MSRAQEPEGSGSSANSTITSSNSDPPQWVADEGVATCQACAATQFSRLNRRHHCRGCGKVVCARCSAARLLLPLRSAVQPPLPPLAPGHSSFDPRQPQRCCPSCCQRLKPQQEHLRATMAHSAVEVCVSRGALQRYFNSPLRLSLQDEIVKATHALQNFTCDNRIEGEDRLPGDLIRASAGVAFITFVRAGLLFTGKIGTGLVVSRRPDGTWSAPAAIASAGVGWGFQAGADVTDVLVLLHTRKAVDAFSGRGSVSLGTQLSISVGPVGRGASTDIRAGDAGLASVFSYAHSKGLFLGASFEAGTIVSRTEANQTFYGTAVSAKELLLGNYPAPKAAEPLYRALEEVESSAARAATLSSAPASPSRDSRPAAATGESARAIPESDTEEGSWDLLLDGIPQAREISADESIITSVIRWLGELWCGTGSGGGGSGGGGGDSEEASPEGDGEWRVDRRKRILAAREQGQELCTAREMRPLRRHCVKATAAATAAATDDGSATVSPRMARTCSSSSSSAEHNQHGWGQELAQGVNGMRARAKSASATAHVQTAAAHRLCEEPTSTSEAASAADNLKFTAQ